MVKACPLPPTARTTSTSTVREYSRHPSQRDRSAQVLLFPKLRKARSRRSRCPQTAIGSPMFKPLPLTCNAVVGRTRRSRCQSRVAAHGDHPAFTLLARCKCCPLSVNVVADLFNPLR